MRECETEKKKELREDEQGGHEFRKSTKCSGLNLHCRSHNDICLIDYSQHKTTGQTLIFTQDICFRKCKHNGGLTYLTPPSYVLSAEDKSHSASQEIPYVGHPVVTDRDRYSQSHSIV